MDKIFQALSSLTRRKILAYLSSASLNAGEIADKFQMSKPTISKHLNILENAGLITSEKNGQFIKYTLVRENLVTNMFDFLSDFCPVNNPLKKESKAISEMDGQDANKGNSSKE